MAEKILVDAKKSDELISNVPRTAPSLSFSSRKVLPALLTVPLGNNHLENIKEEEEERDEMSKDSEDENYENVYLDVSSTLKIKSDKKTELSKVNNNETFLKKVSSFISG